MFGSQKHIHYSDNALTRMREALDEVDMAEIWKKYGSSRGRSGALADSAVARELRR